MMTQKHNRIAELKIYGLLLEYPHTSFLSIQRAYSLEEAMMFAKEEFQRTESPSLNPQSNITPRINLFAIKTLAELNTESFIPELPIQKFPKNSIKTKSKKESKIDTSIILKNNLMKQIIDTKNEKMFQKNKKIFTLAECKFLKKQL